jgi:hypothetical protein
MQQKRLQKEKTPQSSAAMCHPLRELSEPDNLARFHHTLRQTTLTGLTTGPIAGIEHPIIRAIETIRKNN